MTGLIVADAGPLIGLARARALNLLELLYRDVLIPPAVEAELQLDSSLPGAAALNAAVAAGWLRVADVPSTSNVAALEKLLDLGEAQAISLAEDRSLRLLIDERQGRRVAARRGVVVIGTGAVLLAAKAAGYLVATGPVLDELERQGYRLSAALRARLQRLAGEA